MVETAAVEVSPNISRARKTLLRRLIDVVAMPGSRLPPQDRSMAGDVLLEMLFEATDEERAFCANRLVPTHEAPRRVLRYLAQCVIEVAEPLLIENESFDDSDLAYLIETTSSLHARAIARRKTLGPGVCDALVRTRDVEAVKLALSNRRSFISETAMDEIVALSREHKLLCDLLIQREELKPNQALTLFWWADSAVRRQVLMRYAADRSELIEMCGDVFAIAAAEGWSDPVARKTLQLIERRQRNRAAIEKSPYEHLEHAVEVAANQGLSRDLAEEIGYLAGVKPVTVAKILTDKGGEGIAILCKATGLKRPYLARLWVALKRSVKLPDGTPSPDYARVLETYEMMSVAKSQTTLRYWNWSLSSAFTARVEDPADDSPASEAAKFSSSRRTAELVFGR